MLYLLARRTFWAAVVVVTLLLGVSAASAQTTSAARVVPDSWRIVGLGSGMPGSAQSTCDWACKTQKTYAYYTGDAQCVNSSRFVKGYVGWNDTTTNVGNFYGSQLPSYLSNPAPGLNAQGKFNARCVCACHNGNGSDYTWPDGGQPLWQILGDAECPVVGQQLLASYSPATCSVPYGASGGSGAAGSCLSSLAQSIQLSVTLGAGQSATSIGAVCHQGCEYIFGSFQVSGNVMVGIAVGAGTACTANAAQGTGSPVYTTGSGGGGTSSGGGGLTSAQAADLAEVKVNTGRAASAAEATAARITPTDSTLEAEGAAIIASAGPASAATGSALADQLPQHTVDYGSIFSGFTVSLFGTGSCPAPLQLGDFRGTPLTFPLTIVCQWAQILSVFVVMGGAIGGFRIAMKV